LKKLMKPVLSKKICMLGAYSVGKTSLVKHFVHGIFSEKYLITIGVKIDKKTIMVDDQEFKLLLWDIAGEEDGFNIPLSYLKGSDAFLLVIDGTRPETLDQAIDIHARTKEAIDNIPIVAVVNKADLTQEWRFDQTAVDRLKRQNWPIIKSSAKLGTGVEEAFRELVRQILATP